MVPTTLSGDGQAMCEAHCTAAQQGETSFRFRADIYGAEDVKEALIAAQYGKCCFCERKVFADGDVEHFRPKAAVKQRQGSPLLRPGYYWLAYDWNNLLLACSACNSRHKGNLFPLTNPRRRIRNHTESRDLSHEQPLFVDPSIEDPTQYIAFRDEVPLARDGNARGEATIKALGLDRSALNSIRLEHLLVLRQYHYYLQLAESHTDDAEWQSVADDMRNVLEASISDNAEFAAMARAAATRNHRPYSENQ
ncbi:MAG: hypothetical protein V4671_32590 [Armatimonadota bacterium]